MPASNGENGPSAVRRLVTIPNLLSISRLLLLAPVLLFLVKHENLVALALMLISWSTDALDGWFARRLHQVTDLGRVLDHLVDKIWVGSVLVMLVYTSGLPLPLAAAVVVRDLLILAGSLVVMKSRGSFVSSDVLGKITGCAFAVMMVYYILSLPSLLPYKLYVDYTVAVLVVVSFLNYVAVFLRKLGRFRLPGEEHREPNGDG